MLLGPFPGVLALTHASAPIPTDAHSIAFVGDCSDTVVPVSLAQRRVLAVGEIKSVQSVLVYNQSFVRVDHAGIAGIIPAIG